MTDEISVDDIQEQVAERGSDGKLLPEEHTVDWFGEEKVVKTKPITTGVLNELSHVDEAIAELEPQAVHEAFQTIYLSDAILELSVAQIDNMKASALNSLLEPLENEVNESFGDETGNPAEMSRRERAEQMRS